VHTVAEVVHHMAGMAPATAGAAVAAARMMEEDTTTEAARA